MTKRIYKPAIDSLNVKEPVFAYQIGSIDSSVISKEQFINDLREGIRILRAEQQGETVEFIDAWALLSEL